MWTVGRCIVYTGIRRLLLTCPVISSFFFLSNFQTLKYFITLFSGTVRPRRLKFGTHLNSGRMYRVTESACCCLFVPLFLQFSFSPIFKHQKCLSHLSQKLRPIKLTLDIHVDNWWMYHVYRNQAAASYLSLIFFSPMFKNSKFSWHFV